MISWSSSVVSLAQQVERGGLTAALGAGSIPARGAAPISSQWEVRMRRDRSRVIPSGGAFGVFLHGSSVEEPLSVPEFEARLAAAEDAAESDGFERGAASVAEHLGGPGYARKRGGQ